MLGRSTPLTSAALFLGLVALLARVEPAQAHRLNAGYVVLPGHRVQIESWFDTGDSPRSARVQVFKTNGQLLTDGRLNDQGIFAFSFDTVEPLRVVVNAGLGHRKELQISAESLTQVTAEPEKPAPSTAEAREDAPAIAPRVDRTSTVSMRDILIGVGFLLALAAFMLGLRNARQLRALIRSSDSMDGKGPTCE